MNQSRTVRTAALVVGVVAALLVVLLVTRKPAEDRTSASPVVGRNAPALAGKAVIGTAFDIGANDRWLVVNFFATWCVPCRTEHPELKAFSEEHHTDGKAQVVSVVYGDKAKAVKDFFTKRGGRWTVLDSDDGQTALDWGVAKVPESFLVAPTGLVVKRFDTGNGVTKDELDAYINAYESNGSRGAGS
ncbi:MAG: TlpA family protein disulfide reductase [Acidimicrobiales bacterium]